MLQKAIILDLGNYKISHGISLIELLVVVLILSIVLSGAIMSLRHNTPYKEDINIFCKKIQHAQKEAFYRSDIIKAHIDIETGLSFSRYLGDKKWEEHPDYLLDAKTWQLKPILITWCDNSTHDSKTIDIIFYPDGSTRNFCIQSIWLHEDKQIYQIAGNSIGQIHCEY